MSKPSISLAIPAYNEEQNIEAAINSAIKGMGDRFSSYEIIVVNDGSTDGTGPLIDRLANANPNIKAIHHPQNRGMGESLMTGFKHATKQYVGSYPGDDGLEIKTWGDMLDLLGQADVISYSIANPEFRPWRRRIVSWLFVKMLNLRFGLSVDYYNGHAVYKREDIQALKVISGGHTLLSECLIRLIKQGRSFKEIPTLQIERKFGSTKAFTSKNFKAVYTLMFKLPCDLKRQRSSGA